MNILIWVLIGGVTGWSIGKLIHKRTRESRAAYVLLGVIGSVGIALIWSEIKEPVITWFDVGLVLVALIGAAVTTGLGYLVLRHSSSGKKVSS